MSSIERYIDKLDKPSSSGAMPADAVMKESLATAAGGEKKKKSTHLEATIDFGRLQTAGILTPESTQGRLADEYRAIKRPLLKNAFGEGAGDIHHGNLIMVTSALPGEGKSFTAINLAMSMAMELDRTVLLVEADVTKPAVCRYCGIPEPRQGLVDYLADPGVELPDLLIKTNVPKLTLLPAGRRHATSAELLGSHVMRDLMDQLANRYPDRIVIFDSPPLILSSEAVTLSGFMGQIIMVVEAARTQQSIVKQAVALIDPNQIVGVVLNKNRTAEGAGYYGAYGGYGYGYGAVGQGG